MSEYTEAEQAAIDEYIEAHGVYIYSDWGCSDHGECDGWDGYSHRCECGHRRMCWSFDNDDGILTAYPEAY